MTPVKRPHQRTYKTKEEKMAERRKFLRFNTPLDMEYKTLTLNPIFGKSLAKDLSKEGVRFGITHTVPVGTPVEISMTVPGDNLPVFATGKIAWADGLDAGVKLTKISQNDRARVLEYVYKEWLKMSKREEYA
jgi:hypothetical protein